MINKIEMSVSVDSWEDELYTRPPSAHPCSRDIDYEGGRKEIDWGSSDEESETPARPHSARTRRQKHL